MCRGGGQRGMLARGQACCPDALHALHGGEAKRSRRLPAKRRAPCAPTLPSGDSQGHHGSSQPDPGVAREWAVDGTLAALPGLPQGRWGGSTGIGTPNLQMKRLRFRVGQGQSHWLSQSPAPTRSMRVVPLTGPSQLKAMWDPPPAAGSPGSPGPRGSRSLVRTAAAPLDTACQGQGGKDSPHPSWAGPLLSPRKRNRGLETGQSPLPDPRWVPRLQQGSLGVEPEEPGRGRTGQRGGCGPGVQGPNPPWGLRGNSLRTRRLVCVSATCIPESSPWSCLTDKGTRRPGERLGRQDRREAGPRPGRQAAPRVALSPASCKDRAPIASFSLGLSLLLCRMGAHGRIPPEGRCAALGHTSLSASKPYTGSPRVWPRSPLRV